MSSFSRLPVQSTVRKADIIGVAAGQAARPLLLDAAKMLPRAPWTAVDFQGIEMISASAARECVLHLCVYLNELGALPVLVSLNQETLEEIAFAAQALKQPVVVANTVSNSEPTGLRILGDMDSKLRETLRVVARLQETDAKTAHEASQDTSTGVTAWNNRLSTLAGMRLLRERKSGKTKYYSLTLKGLVDGQ